MKFTGDKAFKSIEDSGRFILNYPSYKETGFGRWTVLLKQTGEIIGWCGLKLHPDKNHAPQAEAAFKKVSAAYACLSDKEKRKMYDITGEEPGNNQSPGR